MSKSSEEVLRTIKYVRHRKTDGKLYLLSESFGWINDKNNSTFSIRHKYSEIKVQKVSPQTKEQIKLQLILYDDTSIVFQFCNSHGRDQQIIDRDTTKQIISDMLTKFRKSVDSELQEKNRRLRANPILLQMYKDLVVTEILDPNDFWMNVANLSPDDASNSKQRCGVSADFLANIVKTDGCNTVRYDLTDEIMQSIFKTYPSVYEKFKESVPDKLSEQDFWKIFFQSHYFHRDQVISNKNNFFQDSSSSKESSSRSSIFNELMDASLPEGYGTSILDDESSSGAKNTSSKSKISTINSLIRRFNFHSARVLKTSSNDEAKRTLDTTGENNSSLKRKHPTDYDNLTPAKKRLTTDDNSLPLTSSNSNVQKASHLKIISSSESYLHGPITNPVPSGLKDVGRKLVSSTPGSFPLSPSNSSAMDHSDYLAVKKSDENLTFFEDAENHSIADRICSPSEMGYNMSTLRTLMDIQTASSKNSNDSELQKAIPKDVLDELSSLTLSANELLRHFWLCFPTSTPFLESKVVRMYESLEKFRETKLESFKWKFDSAMVSSAVDRPIESKISVTDNLERMFKIAFEKFNTWKRRQKRLGRNSPRVKP